ncbi:MAG: hypothetical protein AB3N64_08715 [Puniceicoccaceae bacterium]
MARHLSLRELIALSEAHGKEEAQRIRFLMKMIYHSAISPHSKEARNWVKETDKRIEKAI